MKNGPSEDVFQIFLLEMGIFHCDVSLPESNESSGDQCVHPTLLPTSSPELSFPTRHL